MNDIHKKTDIYIMYNILYICVYSRYSLYREKIYCVLEVSETNWKKNWLLQSELFFLERTFQSMEEARAKTSFIDS